MNTSQLKEHPVRDRESQVVIVMFVLISASFWHHLQYLS